MIVAALISPHRVVHGKRPFSRGRDVSGKLAVFNGHAAR
jgi:hypothetical protein